MPLDATQQRLDALLPQTQCQRCGYPGCAPYAAAMAAGEADINRCPPGGDQVIVALAAALRRPVVPLDPELSPMLPAVARIDASECIGCARCLPPCPVDAIVGARQFLHTVLAADCTGCELCLAACPVDCIQLENASGDLAAPSNIANYRSIAPEGTPFLAFGSHVDTQALADAESAGCDQVMPRSKFSNELPRLLAHYFG